MMGETLDIMKYATVRCYVWSYWGGVQETEEEY